MVAGSSFMRIASPSQILFSCNQGRLRYLISDREGGVEDFWSQCRTPTRILAWETLGPRSTARVMGKCRFIRIMSHGETVVDLSPGMTVEHDSGVAIVLPGEPGTSVPIDTWVTVEIGQSEGIYQIDSKVVRATLTPLEGVVPNPKDTHLLIVSFPPSLRVYNQRESYRVGTEFELRANRLAQTADGGSWMSTGESFPCNVVDICSCASLALVAECSACRLSRACRSPPMVPSAAPAFSMARAFASSVCLSSAFMPSRALCHS